MHPAHDETPFSSRQNMLKQLVINSLQVCAIEGIGAAVILFPSLSNLAASAKS
jgi:hypothetical protein